jgi:hypothetical protein
MALLWFVLALAAVDLAAMLSAAETRPGFVHNPAGGIAGGPAAERRSRP